MIATSLAVDSSGAPLTASLCTILPNYDLTTKLFAFSLCWR